MKLIILTQYYPPETGAPQNRLSDLAARLVAMGVEVTVITAMPNYPQMIIHPAYKGKWFIKEEIEKVKIIRCPIYASPGKSIFKRLLNYFSFTFSSFFIGLFSLPKAEFLMVESPPLFLGKTAWLLSAIKGYKLVFNVSDLWPESAEKLGLVTNKLILKITYSLELFLYRRSHLITCQTQGIVADIRSRTRNKDLYWLPNGANMAVFDPEKVSKGEWRRYFSCGEDDFIFLYAGILGHAQGLEVILEAAALLRDRESIKFVLLGSGPEQEKLTALKEQLNLMNVIFAEQVSKNQIPEVLAAVDATVIPLKKLDLFKGAIPSKLFESLAMSKPILLGVDGEARKLFVEEARAGYYFTPENASELAERALLMYNNRGLAADMGASGRQFVWDHFSRDKIATDFYEKLQSLLPVNRQAIDG